MTDIDCTPLHRDRLLRERQAMVRMTEPAPTIYSFVLKYGRWWTPAPLPEGIEPGIAKHCFGSAQVLIKAHPLRFTYVEGYAWLPGVPIFLHHGWAVDSEGNVVDPTWEAPEECSYFGVPFKSGYVARVRRRTLDNVSMLDRPECRFSLICGKEDVWQAVAAC